MDALTLRLQESSAVQQAAEGLTPEQRQLVRERELTALIAALEAERKDIRESLLAHYKETGEVIAVDAYKMEPKKVEVYSYDVEGLVKEFRGQTWCLKANTTALALALENGTVPRERIEKHRSSTTRLDWGVKAVKK